MSAHTRSRVRPTVAEISMRLDGHEDLCGERYRNLEEKIDRADHKIEERHQQNVQRFEAWQMEHRQHAHAMTQQLEEAAREFASLRDALKATDQRVDKEVGGEKSERKDTMLEALKWAVGLLVPALGVAIWYIVTHAKP